MSYYVRESSQHRVAGENTYPAVPTNALPLLQYILFTWSIDIITDTQLIGHDIFSTLVFGEQNMIIYPT